MLIIFPIVYGIIGFVAGAITALIYNLVAKFTGGIEATVTEVGSVAYAETALTT